MNNIDKCPYRADGGDIGTGRLKEIADNPYGDEEKCWLAKRLLALLDELEAKDRSIEEQADIIAKQEKWIKDVEATMIAATDRAEVAVKQIANMDAVPLAPVGEGETVVMPDYPGHAMTQRECFQAGWEAHHNAMLQADAPVQFGWSKGHFGYHTLFIAIGKAVNIQGNALSISVSAFEDAMLAAAPQQEVK